jgi:hypothetical protein
VKHVNELVKNHKIHKFLPMSEAFSDAYPNLESLVGLYAPAAISRYQKEKEELEI